MKKIMRAILLFLALSNGANAAAASAAASYAMARDGEFLPKEECRALVVKHLGGRSLEDFKAEAVGEITEIDLLLMAGSALAGQVATFPENFPSVEFKKSTDLVGRWLTEKNVSPFLGGATIVDISRPRALPEGTKFAFPQIVGITLDTHSKHGIITCFGSTAPKSIRELLMMYAAVHVDGDIDAVVADARERLVHQLRIHGLPSAESLSRLGISLTGNILEEDPEGLMFMGRDWSNRCIQGMENFIRANTPTKVCAPFFIHEMIQGLRLMGGESAVMANAITYAASYNAMAASNALLDKITTCLNGTNTTALDIVGSYEIISSRGNGAPVGKAVSNFMAYGRSGTLFQRGPWWGKALILPNSSSAIGGSRLDPSAETGAGGAAATGAGGVAAVSAMGDSAFGAFQSAPGLGVAEFLGGFPFVGGDDAALYAALQALPDKPGVGQIYDARGVLPDMASSYMHRSVDGGGLLPAATEGGAAAGSGAAVTFTQVAMNGKARDGSVVVQNDSALTGVLSWLSRSAPGAAAAIVDALKVRGIDVSSVLPYPQRPVVFEDTTLDIRCRIFEAFVLATHTPEKLPWDMLIAYAVQRWPADFTDSAAVRLESALSAVADGK